jgi:very-short-patch-repair endonuclease
LVCPPQPPLHGPEGPPPSPIGPFIADFYCSERRLIIEADGFGHGSSRDIQRDAWLTAQGFRILRLWNHDILTNLPGCLDLIANSPEH